MFDKSKYTAYEFMGCTFYLGASKKFDKDLQVVENILTKPEPLTHADRLMLIMIYQTSFHDSGKIEGIMSADSSCHGCEFCRNARKAAETDPTLICKYCYDEKQENDRVHTLNRHQLNMLIMSSVLFTEEELSLVPVSVINRINSSGDVPSRIYALNITTMIALHKNVKFSWWAKNARPVIEAMEELGKPDNLILIYSGIVINRIPKLPKYFDYGFIVAVDKASVKRLLALPNTGECNGKKCKECGFKCYTGAWKDGTIIVEYLRGINKETRNDIIAALKEKGLY